MGDNKSCWYLVVPLNKFTSMYYCPWVQGKANKPPPEVCVCVCGGGVFYDFTSIFSFINIHEYANEIFLYIIFWMKGLAKFYH